MFLSHLPPDKFLNIKTAFGHLKLKSIFHIKVNPPDTSLLIVMVRIIDKMIDQRRTVYAYIDKWLADKDVRNFALAASHAEDIISDAKRIVSFIKAHRSMKTAHVRVEKEMYKRIMSKEKEITEFRNALQHLDKDITSGIIQTGQDFGLVLTETGYQINNFKINYEDLDDFILDCDRYIKNVIAELV